MTATAPAQAGPRGGSPVIAAAGQTAGRDDKATGLILMLTAALSCQFGAATATLAFPALGPAGVVAIRQWVAGAVLVTVGRPHLRSFTWRQWWPVLSLAVVFACMNLSLYVAISRIGLGLAVALEFLGPLAVALAASRRTIDLACALAAGAAVAVLTRPQPTTDYIGIGLGVLAAVCWAAYILLNKTIGRRVPGAQGTAAAAGLSALLYLPVGIWVLSDHTLTPGALGCAATAGILSSAVPFLLDLLALRLVPAGFFGVFMSANPVLAALIGMLLLGQVLRWDEWLAISAIVTANAVSVGTSARSARPRRAAHRRETRSARSTPGSVPPDSGPANAARTAATARPGPVVAAARAAADTTGARSSRPNC
jgi:inner membrane transporter RhtA